LNIEVELNIVNFNYDFPYEICNRYEKLDIWKKDFQIECNNVHKGENALHDTIIDIYNLLWPKLIDNLIRNKVFFMFKVNNLQVKAFDEFIIDPPSTIVIKKTLYIGSIVGIDKSQIMKSICEYF